MQDKTTLLLEAIALKKAVHAVYNRQTVILAPHILYTRHGEFYMDAVTIEREGNPPREIKVSSFKLTGLNELRFSGSNFERYAIYNADEERYVGETLFAIDS